MKFAIGTAVSAWLTEVKDELTGKNIFEAVESLHEDLTELQLLAAEFYPALVPAGVVLSLRLLARVQSISDKVGSKLDSVTTQLQAIAEKPVDQFVSSPETNSPVSEMAPIVDKTEPVTTKTESDQAAQTEAVSNSVTESDPPATESKPPATEQQPPESESNPLAAAGAAGGPPATGT